MIDKATSPWWQWTQTRYLFLWAAGFNASFIPFQFMLYIIGVIGGGGGASPPSESRHVGHLLATIPCHVLHKSQTENFSTLQIPVIHRIMSILHCIAKSWNPQLHDNGTVMVKESRLHMVKIPFSSEPLDNGLTRNTGSKHLKHINREDSYSNNSDRHATRYK